MTPYEAFQLYLAVKNHFTVKSYDFFKYNGKVKTTQASYDTHKNKYMFYKLSKKDDPLNYLVANLSEKPKLWIGDLFDKESEQRYTEYTKRHQSLSYIFKNEIDVLLEDFDENFKIPDGDNPYLLKMFYRKKISKEVLIIIDSCVGNFKIWNKKISDTILWPDTYQQLINYRPFVNIDSDKYCRILRDRFA